MPTKTRWPEKSGHLDSETLLCIIKKASWVGPFKANITFLWQNTTACPSTRQQPQKIAFHKLVSVHKSASISFGWIQIFFCCVKKPLLHQLSSSYLWILKQGLAPIWRKPQEGKSLKSSITSILWCFEATVFDNDAAVREDCLWQRAQIQAKIA